MALDMEWSRITLCLPVNSVEERAAASEAIELIRNNYEGLTHSVVRPHVFEGYWWKKTWHQDKICWLTVDINFPLASPELDLDLAIIKTLVDELYKEVGREQREIWLTAHPVANFS